MALIYDTHSLDYTTRVQYAMRDDDGQWFTRHQRRHPVYGYVWSAWRATATPDRDSLWQLGLNPRRARLPKGAR